MRAFFGFGSVRFDCDAIQLLTSRASGHSGEDATRMAPMPVIDEDEKRHVHEWIRQFAEKLEHASGGRRAALHAHVERWAEARAFGR